MRKTAKSCLKFLGARCVLPLYFRWNARKPADDKLVVFADYWDRAMPDNFRSLYELCEQKGLHCVFLSGSAFSKELPALKRWRGKAGFCLEFTRLYARCRAVFLTDWFPLVYLMKPRAGTEVAQLWHGCGLMKRVGYAVAEGKRGESEEALRRYPMHTNYTLVCTSSPQLRAGYEEAFRCDPAIIRPLGVPRTDIYFDLSFRKRAEEKVRGMFPAIGGRKILLYAPTFRGANVSNPFFESKLDYGKLRDALSDRYVLLTKLHPLMASAGLPEADRAACEGFAFDVSNSLTPEEALCAADILISDYSSILFEYLLLERPIISYVYDIEEYEKERGFFQPFDETVPGPCVFSQDEVVEKIRTVSEWFDVERTRAFREKFMSACDGRSTERIYRYVFENDGKESV